MCRRSIVPVALAVCAAITWTDFARAKPGLLHKRGPAAATTQVAPRLAVPQPSGPLSDPEVGNAVDASLPVMPMPAPLDALGPGVADDGMVSIMPVLPPPAEIDGAIAGFAPGSGPWSSGPDATIGSDAVGIGVHPADMGPVTSSVVTVVTGVHPVATPLGSGPIEAVPDGGGMPLMAMTTAGIERRAGARPTGLSSTGGASAGSDLVDGQSGLTRIADPRLQAVPRAPTPAPRWRDRIRFASPFGD